MSSEGDATTAMDCCLDLMRRCPPKRILANLSRLIEARPDLTEDLLQAVDQPLKIAQCASTGKPFLLCDFNRDGDSYRSPWSNQYQPQFDEGVLPSDELRGMEQHANDIFYQYAYAYHHEGVVSSVYCWDVDGDDPNAFAMAVLIKKQQQETGSSWDAIHVVEATPKGAGKFHYKLTSSVLLSLQTPGKTVTMDLSGSVTRQREGTHAAKAHKDHISNIGGMIQETELQLRTQIHDVYFGKSAEILAGMHTKGSLAERDTKRAFASDLSAALAQRTK